MRQYSHSVHLCILVGTIAFSTYLIFSSYSQITVADEYNSPVATATDSPDTKSVSTANNASTETSVLLQELSKLATDETVKTIADQIGSVSTLSSEQTQKEIRDKIETNLAKESSLLALIADIRHGNADNQTVLFDLSNLLSKAATESTLTTLVSKYETGLAKDASIQQMILDLSTRLDEVNQKLAGSLSVSVSNWVTSISITNFPTNYPSSSTERVQDIVGTDYFNKSEDFKSWSLRKDYGRTAFSGEIANPKTGPEVQALKITVPAGHTYYVYRIAFASASSDKNTNFKIYYKPSGGGESGVGKIVIPSPDTKNLDYDKKLKESDEFRLTIEPITTASSTSTATIFYYDLPWVE